MNTYSDCIPSFDPALLNSELEFLDAPASNSFSDDLNAIQQCFADEKARKTSAGIVIQHRIWSTVEAFRSEEDHPIGTANGRAAQKPN
jgi:chromosome transmission fidelity protein 18